MADDDGGINKEIGSFIVVRVMAVAGSGKRQARSPTDHFEKLLEQTCLNHAYPASTSSGTVA
jgi:hypothetical protein